MSLKCFANSDCNSDLPICDVLTGKCVQCLNTENCSIGNWCNVQKKCTAIPLCSEDVNCSSYAPYVKCTRKTDQTIGICTGCNNDKQCLTNEKCIDNICKSNETPCSVDGDCSGSNICQYGICTPFKISWLAVGIVIAILIFFVVFGLIVGLKRKT